MKTYAIVNILKKKVISRHRLKEDAENMLGTPKKDGTVIKEVESEDSLYLPSDEFVKNYLGW